MARFDLTDEEWAVVAPLLPAKGRRPERKDDRIVLNGIFYIFYILRTGAPWRDLPERYGPHTTIYNRYARWAKRDVWRDIFEALANDCKDALIFVGSSIVKAHRTAAGSKGGSWRRVSGAHAEAAAVRFTLL